MNTEDAMNIIRKWVSTKELEVDFLEALECVMEDVLRHKFVYNHFIEEIDKTKKESEKWYNSTKDEFDDGYTCACFDILKMYKDYEEKWKYGME